MSRFVDLSESSSPSSSSSSAPSLSGNKRPAAVSTSTLPIDSAHLERFNKNFSFYLESPFHGNNPIIRPIKGNDSNMEVKCLLCPCTSKPLSITKICPTNFEKHLKSTHPNYLRPEKLLLLLKDNSTPKSQSTLSFSSPPNEEGSQTQSTSSSPSTSVHSSSGSKSLSLAKAACIGGLPLSFSESVWFKFIIKEFVGDTKIPGRFAVTTAFDALSKDAITSIKETLAKYRVPLIDNQFGTQPLSTVSLCIDFWSCRTLTSYFGVIGRLIGPDWRIHEVLLCIRPVIMLGADEIDKDSGHNASLVSKALKSLMDTLLGQIPFEWRRLTADGGSDISKMIRTPSLSYCPQENFVTCVSHTMHIIMGDVFRHESIKEVVEMLDYFVLFFSNSEKRQKTLARALGSKVLRLLPHVPTRWGSRLRSWIRLLHPSVSRGIRLVTPTMLNLSSDASRRFSENQSMFIQMEVEISKVVSVLRNIQACIDGLERQNVITISRTYFCLVYIKRLFEFMQKTSSPEGFCQNFARVFLDSFTKERTTAGGALDLRCSARFAQIPQLYHTAAFLDPSTCGFYLKDRKRKFFNSWTSDLAAIKEHLWRTATPLLSDAADERQRQDFQNTFEFEFGKLDVRVQQQSDNANPSSLSFHEFFKTLHIIPIIAREILSQGVSCANIESIWSSMGLIDSERRSSLTPSRLASLGLCRNILLNEMNATDDNRKARDFQSQQNAEQKATAHADEIWHPFRVSFDFMVQMDEANYPQAQMNQSSSLNPTILPPHQENADEFIDDTISPDDSSSICSSEIQI